MHEFSLCQSLMREATKIAATRSDELSQHQKIQTPITLITGVTARIGLFAGIDKHLLKRAFDIAIQDHHRQWQDNPDGEAASSLNITFAPRAQLTIESLPGAIFCRECNRNYRVDQQEYSTHHLNCTVDPTHHTHLVGGDELLLVNVQLQQVSLEEYCKYNVSSTSAAALN
ncbi:Zn finger protein HypA/HybF involved in hydrogenase expression [Alteromonadaceae bacterium 2753L.S.0a.02]|nr:Zn finger protein HypA/HybF involved in hydrogenase expression [Alteromonadaceae bacterium 2753L.S.0a.02]